MLNSTRNIVIRMGFEPMISRVRAVRLDRLSTRPGNN